jgi:hypothetical protein
MLFAPVIAIPISRGFLVHRCCAAATASAAVSRSRRRCHALGHGMGMSGLAELDNAPSATTCGEVNIYAPQQTHALPMPHLSRTGNNPHPLSRARADANRALHPLPRSRPQRARDSLANARSSLATQSSQTRRHERMVRPLEEPALVLRRASLTRLRVQMRRWLSP